MAAYESIFILRPDLDEEAVGKTCDRVAALVGNNNGSVIALEKMGHRRLAYEVKDHMDGYYVILNYEGQPETTRELERTFKISDEFIRHIIVKREVPYKPAQVREAAKETAQAEAVDGAEAPAAAPAAEAPAAAPAEGLPVEGKAEETPAEPKAEEAPAQTENQEG
jgi:small subunit ribosomal protein S6